VDLSQFVQLTGMVVDVIVQHFRKIAGDFRLGLLVVFGRFASVDARTFEIVEVLFAGASQRLGLERKHPLLDDALVHGYLLEKALSSQMGLAARGALTDERG